MTLQNAKMRSSIHMKNVHIHIHRNPEQSIEINENQVDFIRAIQSKDTFLKRAAADFLRKKKIYEVKKRS